MCFMQRASKAACLSSHARQGACNLVRSGANFPPQECLFSIFKQTLQQLFVVVLSVWAFCLALS